MFLDRWLFYPWLRNSNLDFLISEDDLGKVDGLGVVLCIEEDENFIIVKNSQGAFKVRIEGVKRVLPSPKFTWGEEVYEIGKLNAKGVVEDFFWNHSKQEYLYYISINGKRKSRQFSECELSR